MKIKELEKELAKREGKGSQVSIGNIREIVGHISDVFAETGEGVLLAAEFLRNGERRAKRKKK